MGSPLAFIHNRHVPIHPANEVISWGPATSSAAPDVSCFVQVCSFHNQVMCSLGKGFESKTYFYDLFEIFRLVALRIKMLLLAK